MEKIALLLFSQQQEIDYERKKRLHFGLTGDGSVYLMPPAIILGKAAKPDITIPFIGQVHALGEFGRNRYGFYQRIEEEDLVHRLQRQLGMEEMDTGVALSGETPPPELYGKCVVTIHSIAIAESDGMLFRIIRTRRLSKDKQH